MENKNNQKAVISFVLSIVGLLILLFYPDEKTVMIAFVLMLVLGLGATILGFMSKSEINKQPQKGKGLATTGIVIGIITIIFGCFGFIGLKLLNDPDLVNQTLCPQSTDCVEKDENNYTCNYFGNEITCGKDFVKENNMKK